MKRRALLLALASSACHGKDAEQQPFTRALFTVAERSGHASKADIELGLAELRRLGEMARAAVAARAHQSEASVVAELVFGRFEI